jgi:iron complex outermembrane receptor protein
MQKSTIASLIGLAFVTPTYSAENINLDDVVVTANRFNENSSPVTVNIKTITKEEIQSSPAINIPDLLRMQAGINIRNLYGNQGIDATVDMRGFGDAAISNTLILLDGQRLNSVDGGNIQWASIPLQAIDHIEIVPGGGTVLYGDRATGGVINIITDKSGNERASATATFGSYGYKGLDGFVSGNLDDAYFNTYVHTADGNGWRQNTASNSWSINGRGGLNFNSGETFIDYSVYRVANGLPGSINSTTYNTNPRSARTPFDSQTKDGFRIRPGISIKLSENVEIASELSVSQEDQHFNDVSFSFRSDHTVDNYSFTPRIKWAHNLGNLSSTTVFGFDYYHGTVDADNHGGFANQKAHQTSNSLYAQNITALSANIDFSAGLRGQKVDQQARQAAVSGNAEKYKSAYDFGLIYHEASWSAYAKAGSSFRFANTDELFGFDPITFTPVFSGNIIRPQTAQNQEIGFSFQQNILDGKIALYHTNVANEIGFDGTQGINTNFDPTRHQGIEADLGLQLLDVLKAKASYAYNDVKFRSGINKGNTLPFVPKNSAHAQLLWDAHIYGKYVAQLNYVGERYTSGDFANSLNKLPSYTTMDLRANWDLKPITLSLTGLNIMDKRYSQYALYALDPATGFTKSDYFYYPADGRTLYLSIRYDFK